MDKIYVKFPKVGLGNMMLVWARAHVFAEINGLSYVTSSWWGLRWGALLRKEKRNRLYWEYFHESGVPKRLRLKLFSITAKHIYNPPVMPVLSNKYKRNRLFIFNKVNIENDLFKDIRVHEQLVKRELSRILHPRIEKILNLSEKPVISAHIRRGDFKLANPVTALSFFIAAINIIRHTTGSDIPVTIFSDAPPEELISVLKLPAVTLAAEKPDIVDILLMSKSRIIILSRSSSFSYWAAFLSDALIVIPMEDWQKKIKDSTPDCNYKEIRWKEGDYDSTTLFKEALITSTL